MAYNTSQEPLGAIGGIWNPAKHLSKWLSLWQCRRRKLFKMSQVWVDPPVAVSTLRQCTNRYLCMWRHSTTRFSYIPYWDGSVLHSLSTTCSVFYTMTALSLEYLSFTAMNLNRPAIHKWRLLLLFCTFLRLKPHRIIAMGLLCQTRWLYGHFHYVHSIWIITFWLLTLNFWIHVYQSPHLQDS